MNEKKDYQRPYFKQYMVLVGEIEKLPPSEQQTKVVTMFHEFYRDMRDSCELTSELSVKYIAKCADLQSTITRQDDLIERLKEDAERLATKDSWRTGDSDSNGEWCKFCFVEIIGDNDGDVYECKHEPTCPVTLHNQLMKSLEGE